MSKNRGHGSKRRILGDIPARDSTCARLRRSERAARIAAKLRSGDVVAETNMAACKAKRGAYLHPTKGWKRCRFYLTGNLGDLARPNKYEMHKVFLDTITRAQKAAKPIIEAAQ